MTQTIEYVVRVASDKANAAIADLEMRWRGVGNQATIAGGKMDRAAGGTRNFGQAAMEGSRALEDLQYGIGGVVNNIPSLVMGLGAGAGLAAAISVVAVGASQLYKNWDAVSAAFGSSTADFKAVQGAVKDLGDAFDLDLNKRMKEGRQQLKDLKDELRDFGLTARDKSLEEQARNLEDMERRRDNLAENRRFLQARANDAESKRDTDRYKEQKAILDEADRRARVLDADIKEAQSNYVQTAKTVAELRAKEAAADAARNREAEAEKRARKAEADRIREEARTVVESGSDGIATGWEEADQRRREKLNEDAINEALKRDQKIADNEEMFANMRYEQQKAQAARMQALWVDYGTGVAAAVGEFAASAAMGQEEALANLLGAASRSAGGFVMLEGGKVMATGIAGMIAAPNPLSAAQIAGGAALVAAGSAIQTGGPAAVSALMGKGGGSAATSGPTGSTRDPGASPRSSGGGASSGGGPLIVNINMGVGGTLPEDIAREIYIQTRTGDRRAGR